MSATSPHAAAWDALFCGLLSLSCSSGCACDWPAAPAVPATALPDQADPASRLRAALASQSGQDGQDGPAPASVARPHTAILATASFRFSTDRHHRRWVDLVIHGHRRSLRLDTARRVRFGVPRDRQAGPNNPADYPGYLAGDPTAPRDRPSLVVLGLDEGRLVRGLEIEATAEGEGEARVYRVDVVVAPGQGQVVEVEPK
jgi:hypothetical protein